MKKILTTTLLTSIIFGGLVPSVANAAWWEFLSPSTWAPAAIYALGGIVVTLTAGVLWISNEIFNFSIYLSIYGFNDFLDGTGVNEAWEIMRDFTNIFFIFILLYIAVGTMFQLFSAKQLLVRVIIVALLINFSAILPKVIIDTSNILAIEFYERIGDGKTPTGAPDVTKAIVSRLGLFSEPEGKEVNLLDEYKSASKDANSKRPTSSVTGALVSVFGKIVFLLVTAFVLAIGAWMFVLRTVVLLLLIIFSPIAVLAAALPKTYSFFDKWLKRLINEAFFAPAYLFMLYITITIVKGMDFGKLVKVDDSQSAVYAPVVVAFNFFVIIFLMSASLIIAKMMGAQGAAQIGKAKSFGLGLVGGATGLAGAYSIGQLANRVRNTDLIKNMDKSATGRFFKDKLVNPTLGRAADAKYGGSASYKERVEKTAGRIDQFKTPKDQAEFLASLSEDDRKAAYKKLSDRQRAEVHEYNDEQLNIATPGGSSPAIIDAARVAHGKIANIGPKAGTEDYEKLEAEKKKIVDRKNVKKAVEDLKPVIPPTPPGMPPPLPGAPPPPLPTAKVETALKTLKGKNVNKLDPDTLTRGDVAPHLSIQHLAAIKEHDNMNQTDRDKIRAAIEKAVGVTATNRTPTIGTPEQQKVYNWLETKGGVEF